MGGVIEVTTRLYVWADLMKMVWGGSYLVLKEIEKQNREMEAWAIIKSYDKEYLGHIPKQEELMDFIQFELPEIMHLYDEK